MHVKSIRGAARCRRPPSPWYGNMCSHRFATSPHGHIMRRVSPRSCITSRHSTSLCPASLRAHTCANTPSICRMFALPYTEAICRRRLWIASRAAGASAMNPANARGRTSPRSSFPRGKCLSKFKMWFTELWISGTPDVNAHQNHFSEIGPTSALTWVVPAQYRIEV